MGYRKIKLDCASVCSDARSRGQLCHCANLLIMLILRDKNSVLILGHVLFFLCFSSPARVAFGRKPKKKKKMRIIKSELLTVGVMRATLARCTCKLD